MAANKYYKQNPDKVGYPNDPKDYKDSFDPKTPPDSEYTAGKAKTTGPNDPIAKKAPRNRG
jgi:hypothetical protein